MPSSSCQWRAALTPLALGLFSPALLAQAAPQWNQFQRTESHAGYVGITLDPNDFELRFEKRLPTDRPLGHPVAGDGVIAAHRNDSVGLGLYVFDHLSGDQLWSEDFESFDASTLSGPALLSGGLVIEAMRSSYTSEFYFYDKKLGVKYVTAYGLHGTRTYQAPTIYGNVAYLASGRYDGVAAREIATGNLLWSYDSNQVEGDWTPAVDDDRVYIYLEGKLHAYDRLTGAVEYKVPDPSWNSARHDFPTPILGSLDNVVLSQFNRIMSWDRSTGVRNWEVAGNYFGASAIGHSMIFTHGWDGQVYALAELDGTELWEWTPPNSEAITSEIIVTDSHFICASDSTTYMVDLNTRQVDWLYPNGGQLALAESNLIIAGRYGHLSVIGYRGVPTPASLDVDRVNYFEPSMPTVTIVGEGFTEAAEIEIWFGDEKADQVQVLDEQTLTCRPPERDPGIVDVTVRNSHGYGTLPAAFAYTPCQVLEGEFVLGGTLSLELRFEPSSGIAVLYDFGDPRPQSVQIPPYIGDYWLQAYQFLFEISSWPFDDRLDLEFQIPMNPSLVGQAVQVQSVIGPNPRGKDAAFTNLSSFVIQ